MAIWENVKDLLTGKTLAETRTAINDLQMERLRTEEVNRQTRSLAGTEDYRVVRAAINDILADRDRTGNIKKMALSQPAVGAGPVHRMTPLLLAALQADVPVLLSGDVGSGKTTATNLAASYLGLNFRCTSFCPTSSRVELFGYKDAGGNYQTTEFRRIFELGGVYCLEEIDNGNPQVIAGMNTALANDVCAFPDAMIPRHSMARFVATANTTGRGATDIFSQRGMLDAATIDRFAYLRFDIDDDLERALLTGEWDGSYMVDIGRGGIPNLNEWLKFVRYARDACKRLGIHCAISPRASIYGSKLMSVGVGMAWLKEMLIWKGLPSDDRSKIFDSMTRFGYSR
jgi:cobaltochelatase CobS